MNFKYLFYFTILFTLSCNESNKKVKIDYYKNGSIKSIKKYRNGIIEGQSQWFYPNGIIEQVVNFRNGMENGNAYYFYESGTLKHFRYWRDSKMVGYVCDYYDDSVGIIKAVLYFNSDGYIVYKKKFDSLGHFIDEEGQKPRYP